MKSKIQIGSMKELKHFIIALLLIAIPIYILSYCLRMREESFGLFGDHSKDWEGFRNMDGKKKKMNDFPPLPSGVADDLKSTLDGSGDFKGSPNEDLLHQLNPKMPIHKMDKMAKMPDEKNKMLNDQIKRDLDKRQGRLPPKDGKMMRGGGIDQIPKEGDDQMMRGGVDQMPIFKPQKKKPAMGYIPFGKDQFANRISNMPQPPSGMNSKCGFYSDSCPTGYESVSGFGIQGLPSGMTLQCGNTGSSSSQSGKFIAEIQSGSIKSVNIVNGGSGYDKTKTYKVSVNGGGGSGANLEAIIDDKGTVQVINVLNGGSGYTSTPQIVLQNGDGSNTGSSCQFCCPNA